MSYLTFNAFAAAPFKLAALTGIGPGTTDLGFGTAYVPQTITAFQISGNVVTFQCQNSQLAGNPTTISGLSIGTYLNGQTLTVLSAGLSNTQFSCNFTHANVGLTSDSGIATQGIAGSQLDFLNILGSGSSGTTQPYYAPSIVFTFSSTAGTLTPIGSGTTVNDASGGHGGSSLYSLETVLGSGYVIPAGTVTVFVTIPTNSNNPTYSDSSPEFIVADTTSTTLASDHNPSTSGQSVTFTATVQSTYYSATGQGGGYPEGGTVTFFVDSVQLGSPVSLTHLGTNPGRSTAAISTSSLTAGSHSIVAVYSGYTGPTYVEELPSTSSPLTQVVTGMIPTTTTVTTNIDPSDFGELVTFTAIVNGPGGTGSPTGTITFNIDGINVNSTPAIPVSTGVSQAQYSISTLSIGVHPVFASYSGDSQYLPSVSPIIDQVVIQPCAFPFSFALQELANRLYDPNMQFWSLAELVMYIQEAFRTWNALASYWRGDFTFQTQQGVVFYDITNTTVAPNTLRPHTITDQYLYTIMEYHLLEPPVGAGLWTGSAQFSIDDILNATQRRQNEILGVTGCAFNHSTTVAAPDRIYMLNTTLDIRRVAFIGSDGSISPMFEDDTWGIQAFNNEYTTQPQGIPSVYRKSTEPLLSFDADVPPTAGLYDLVTIESGPELTAAQASTLTIPDDWMWVLKWGALADLLGRESNAKDLLRAKYCEGRYKQGLQLLAASAAVLAMRSNNIPLQVDAVKSADLYNPLWQGSTPGPPQEAMTASLNLVALSPPPDAGPYSLTVTVVENAPVPVNPTDCLLITQDIFDVLMDYAQHLAMFKCGGVEFTATEPLLQRFMQMAALYSSRLAEQGEFTKILYAMSQNEANMNPRYTPDSDPAAAGDQ